MKKKEFDKKQLKKLYYEDKKSILEISKILNCSPITLRKAFNSFNLETDKTRKKSNPKIELNEMQRQVLFGGLLGDAHLTKQKVGNSQLNYVSNIKSHVEYFQGFFKEFGTKEYENGPSEYIYEDKRTKKTYTRYIFRTQLNIIFTEIRKKWYDENGIKIIPENLILTPLVCLLWYLGDGGLIQRYKKRETASIKLSVNCFKKEDIEKTLIPQLKEFEAWCSKSEKGQPIILIPRRGIEKFLKFIGKCPFKEYEYKWDVFPYKNKNIEINGVKNHKHLREIFVVEYKKGNSYYDIAKKLNVDPSLVRYHLKQEGILVAGRDKKKITWTLKDPEGNLHETENLSKFAKENNLSHLCLRRIANGETKFHKGWICNYK